MKTLPAILLVALLAGCVADPSPSSSTMGTTNSTAPGAPPLVASTSAAAAAPTEETGSIRVTVTTSELAPVETAQVTLADTEWSQFTDADGVAIFNELTPGSYTVIAAKPGYAALENRGRIAEVLANEVTETKLTLDAIEVLDADNSYYTTTPFTGFIACGFEAQPGAVLGRSTVCGHWLSPGGVSLGDPNDKSIFPWSIENMQILGIVLEGTWQAATGATGTQLRMAVHDGYQCSTATCVSNGFDLFTGGPPPLHIVGLEGPEHTITKDYGEDPTVYPVSIWAETMAYCTTNCTGIQVVFQQDFDMYVTGFYGREPPAEFRALPP